MATDLASLPAKASALGQLLRTSDEDYQAFMQTYDSLFTEAPENTKDDFTNGVPMRGYRQGSSPELAHYYRFIHLLCTLGSVEKMYLPPAMDLDESVRENQRIFEREMVVDLGVGPGDQVLDLGCGCGAIASHVADLSGCTVHGVNIDASQIRKAWKNPNRAQLHFQVADFNEPLPFGDEMFDGAYNIQALTYATDLTATFREVFRTLKPGATFVVNDVAALDAYDRDDPEHRMLIQHTRELTAFGGFWHARYWEAAFEAAGFEVVSSEGRSAYEMIRKERALYGRYNRIAERLTRLHVIPAKLAAMLKRMDENSASYETAEERELISLNWRFVARKPA